MTEEHHKKTHSPKPAEASNVDYRQYASSQSASTTAPTPVTSTGQPLPPNTQQYAAAYQQANANPGDTPGIIGLVLNFIGISVGGIILGVISMNRSKAAGRSTVLGLISLIWGIVATVIFVIAVTFMIIAAIISSQDKERLDSYVNPSTSIDTPVIFEDY